MSSRQCKRHRYSNGVAASIAEYFSQIIVKYSFKYKLPIGRIIWSFVKPWQICSQHVNVKRWAAEYYRQPYYWSHDPQVANCCYSNNYSNKQNNEILVRHIKSTWMRSTVQDQNSSVNKKAHQMMGLCETQCYSITVILLWLHFPDEPWSFKELA